MLIRFSRNYKFAHEGIHIVEYQAGQEVDATDPLLVEYACLDKAAELVKPQVTLNLGGEQLTKEQVTGLVEQVGQAMAPAEGEQPKQDEPQAPVADPVPAQPAVEAEPAPAAADIKPVEQPAKPAPKQQNKGPNKPKGK